MAEVVDGALVDAGGVDREGAAVEVLEDGAAAPRPSTSPGERGAPAPAPVAVEGPRRLKLSKVGGPLAGACPTEVIPAVSVPAAVFAVSVLVALVLVTEAGAGSVRPGLRRRRKKARSVRGVEGMFMSRGYRLIP